jgi:hypothetical protein
MCVFSKRTHRNEVLSLVRKELKEILQKELFPTCQTLWRASKRPTFSPVMLYCTRHFAAASSPILKNQ